jgi:CDP-diacylglycerol---glycerol-3-phosphate 3-phosphatidyltransferase
MSYDTFNALGLMGLAALVCLGYGLRLLLRGRARFERVERQGGSVLLGKRLMEIAYWSLQPVGQILVTLGITPNQISWASLVLGGVAGVFLAYGKFGSAALCASLSALFDALDGMVAHATGSTSRAGEVLDSAIDRYTEFFLLAGAVLHYREYPSLQIAALFAFMGSFMVSYSSAKAEALQMRPPPGIMRRPERAFYLIIGATLSALPIGWNEIAGLAAPAGIPMAAALVFIAVLSNISAVERLYSIARDKRIEEFDASAKPTPEPSPRRLSPDPGPAR